MPSLQDFSHVLEITGLAELLGEVHTQTTRHLFIGLDDVAQALAEAVLSNRHLSSKIQEGFVIPGAARIRHSGRSKDSSFRAQHSGDPE